DTVTTDMGTSSIRVSYNGILIDGVRQVGGWGLDGLAHVLPIGRERARVRGGSSARAPAALACYATVPVLNDSTLRQRPWDSRPRLAAEPGPDPREPGAPAPSSGASPH